jgi:hypothetical protein
MSLLGQKPALPQRNIGDRFSSMSGHTDLANVQYR